MQRRALHEAMAREAGRQAFNRAIEERNAERAKWPMWKQLLDVLGFLGGPMYSIVLDCIRKQERDRVYNALEASESG